MHVKKGSGGRCWRCILCIRENLDASEVPELDVDAEIISAKVSLSKRSPVHVCSFYHPPDQSTDPIVQLDSSLNTLICRSANLPNIIVMEDFNLPSIYHLGRWMWSDYISS